MNTPPSLSRFSWRASAAALTVAIAAFAPAAHASDRYSALVIDTKSNQVIHADQADELRYPASLTKMMTLYMLFEALERGDVKMSTRMAVSRTAAAQPPSRLGLRRNETISVEQAIEALVTKSANDVAVVVAERLAGGSERAFADKMTTRARSIGMRSTTFRNASGLPNPLQVTTARDMAVLGEALRRDFPQYFNYFELQGMTWKARYNRNHNGLLGRVTGVDGIKTGYTRASGFNLVSSVERNGQRLIAVVMGGESAAARDNQMAHLIEGAYEHLAHQQGAPSQAVVFAALPVMRTAVTFNDGGAPVTTIRVEQGAYSAGLQLPGETSAEAAEGEEGEAAADASATEAAAGDATVQPEPPKP
jgi:D-alanyl-D-alanine carboxypeptidase